jgi:hypothetical protein
MALQAVLLAAAGMNMIVGQDPRMDLQFAVPTVDHGLVPYVAKEVASVQVQGGPGSPGLVAGNYNLHFASVQETKRVTATFRAARAAEVLSWLEKQGVSFIVADGTVPPNTTVTVNLVNQPLPTVVDALGRALGGHWVRQGEIRVFQRGPGFTERLIAPAVTGTADLKVPAIRVEELEKRLGPEFEKRMEARMKALETRMTPTIEKRVAESMKAMEKSAQIREEAMKRVYERSTAPPIVRTETRVGTTRVAPTRDSIRISTMDGAGLIRSLDSGQRHTMRTRGYLRYDELSAAQKRMLGSVPSSATFEIRFKINNEEVVVRGN